MVRVYRFDNPYSRPKRFAGLKKLMLPILLISWVAILLYAPHFRIQRVVFFGLNAVPESALLPLTARFLESNRSWWPNNNYFLMNVAALESELAAAHNLVESVSIAKHFPGELHINVTEKISAILLLENGNVYLMDKSGTALEYVGTWQNRENGEIPPGLGDEEFLPRVKKLRDSQGGVPFVVSNGGAGGVAIGERKFSASFTEGIINFDRLLREAKIATPHYFIIENPDAGAVAATNQGWQIKFQPIANLNGQLENLRVITRSNKPSAYVDVRFGDRVFWK